MYIYETLTERFWSNGVRDRAGNGCRTG